MLQHTLLQKKVILPVIGVALSAATLFGVSQIANAQTGNNFQSGLVDKLAQTFNLDKSKVQSVVDQYHQQNMQIMQQDMQARQKIRLDKLVRDGKITSSQEQAIITEMANLKNKYNPASLKSMTADQSRQAFQNMQNDIKSWAQSQGIDQQYLMPFGGMGVMRWGRGHKPMSTPTPTS